ncbi:hypothetical protein [Nitratifractor sp.]
MFKGFIALLLVGGAFAYFVFHFVGDIQNDDSYGGASTSVDTKNLQQYYVKDALGEPVLSVGTLPLDKAKTIWRNSPLREEMLELFPHFDQMKTFVDNRINPSPFKDALRKHIETVEDLFLSGKIDSQEARARLERF